MAIIQIPYLDWAKPLVEAITKAQENDTIVVPNKTAKYLAEAAIKRFDREHLNIQVVLDSAEIA